MSNFYLFGKGDLAIYFAEKYIEIFDKSNLKIIPTLPEPDWTGSLLSWSNKNEIELLNFSYLENNIIEKEALGLSIFYDKIFKPNVINKFFRLYNIHNSPLPKYRGVNPINWALKNGEDTHGVTLHLIDEGIDTGPIGDQLLFEIHQDMEVIDVYHKCIESGKQLIDRNIEYLRNMNLYAQNELDSSYYSKKDFDRLDERKFFKRN